MPVRVPALAGVDQDVAEVLNAARSNLDRAVARADSTPAALAEVYGQTGLLYHAHLLLAPAADCYANAERLQPDDHRWPYYRAYLEQQAGRSSAAAQGYRRVLQLEPELATARLRLGRLLAEQDDVEAATELLRQAARRTELRTAAEFELGKLALSRRDYARAADLFISVLQAQPQATQVHYSLALALRGRGDVDAARRHLDLRGERLPEVPDALIDALTVLSTGQRMLFHAGMDAAHRDDFERAARLFAKGVALQPDNLDARVSLARFRFLTGDATEARRQLEDVLQRAPGQALARFFLALLDHGAGDLAAAISGYRQVLETDAGHAGAHYLLAGALFRKGAFNAAVEHYGRALQREPDNVSAAYWRIVALLRAGRAEADVLPMLETVQREHGPDPSVSYLLSALLASADDRRIRDGPRASALAAALHDQRPTPEHAELMALTLAQTGDFAGAVEWQTRAVDQVLSLFRFDLVADMRERSRRYRAREPAAISWPDWIGHLQPGLNLRKVFRVYPPAQAY